MPRIPRLLWSRPLLLVVNVTQTTTCLLLPTDLKSRTILLMLKTKLRTCACSKPVSNTAPRLHVWLAWINEDAYSTWAPLATRALMQSRLPERAALWIGVSPSQSWNDRMIHNSEDIQIHILESLMKAMDHLSLIWNRIRWAGFDAKHKEM